MIDIKLIREEPNKVRKNLEKRQDEEILHRFDSLVEKDKKRLAILKETENLRKQRNEITKEISQLKQRGEKVEGEMKKAGEIGKRIKNAEEELEKLTKETEDLLYRIPNLLHESVPYGKDDHDNKTVRVVGKKPRIKEGKSHLEILEALDMIDFERGAKVAGHQFYYLKGKAVILDIALQRFALDYLIKRGFTVVEPPLMLNDDAFHRVTDWETFNDQSYKIEGEDLRLIGTAEHPLGAMFKDEVLLKKDMPILLAGVSPCFRKEVGTHGKYTKGLFRVHHFNKVEQFVFCHPDESWKWHEKIQDYAEDLLKKLGLHYRVVNVCTGDLGDIAAKKYDIEMWMADGEFREEGSNSNCTDYQARRLNIKFRKKQGMAAEGFVHTLNNTAIATSRAMVALIEQNQQKDGTVKMPAALIPYTGFKKLDGE